MRKFAADKSGILTAAVSLVVCFAAIIFAGPFFHDRFGYAGTALTQLIFVCGAFGACVLFGGKIRHTFMLRIPKLIHTAGALVMWIGAFILSYLAAQLTASAFPESQKVSESVASALSGPTFGLTLIFSALVPAVAEEFVFRGAVMHGLKELPFTAKLFSVTLLFTLAHIEPLRMPPVFVLSAAITYAALRSGSILIPVFMHFLSNTMSSVMVFYPKTADGIHFVITLGGRSPLFPYIIGGMLFMTGMLLLKYDYSRKTEMPLGPIKTSPCYKQMPWGGTLLNDIYGKKSPYPLTGESWEAASHKNGSTQAVNGPDAGLTPAQFAAKYGIKFTGKLGKAEFPVLFKLIDARDRLSVQVHPDDAQAKADGDNGKTEMWIVLKADDGAGLYLGFENPLTTREYAERIEQGTLEDALHYEPARAGDVFFLPAGLVHAIGGGLVIAEIQQNSDATYRVYDWGRMGLDGKPRELHIEKALAVTNTELRGEKAPCFITDENGVKRAYTACCPLFAAVKTDFDGTAAENTGDSLHIIFIADGRGTVETRGGREEFTKGDTFLIPAAAGEYGFSGCGQYYRFFIPDFQKDIAAPLLRAGYTKEQAQSLFHE